MPRRNDLAIVLNPSAGGGYDERRVEALRAIAGSSGVVFSTGQRELLDAVAQGVRERRVATVAIIGGDGTVSNVLTALHNAYRGDPLPRVALLRGGTMNTIANSFGVARAQPEELLRRLVSSPSYTLIERATVQVENRLGFFFCAGAMVGFLRVLYASEGPKQGPLGALRLLAKGSFQAFAGGQLLTRIESPLSATLRIDGVEHPARRYAVLGAGTIEQAGLGFRPFPLANECQEQMQMFAFLGTTQALVRQLPSIRRGLPAAKGLAIAPLIRTLEIETSGEPIEYALDGDIYETGSALRVDTGPTLEIRLP
jgi:diacylglycerol kinase family enzyme